jgi:hypothetical protein
MLSTYYGGIATFTQTTPGAYGSGGSYSPSTYDNYQPKGGGPVSRFVWVDVNQNNLSVPVPVKCTTTTTGRTCTLVDNKSFIFMNCNITFSLDKNNNIIDDKTDMWFTGYTIGTYTMNAVQNPFPYYKNNNDIIQFQIEATWTVNGITQNFPVSVDLSGMNSASPTGTVNYGILP